ncbi:hypothetical protein DL93DRAFT_2073422 [Clavulina sp. PMI_390]|nr:hypothetical protein DL93DRAFT_2073422 [Clavulina sp. PMI_390]
MSSAITTLSYSDLYTCGAGPDLATLIPSFSICLPLPNATPVGVHALIYQSSLMTLVAALKCRQRKKAWLNQLQAKVEYLTAENERLQNTTVSMREEISRLSAVVVAHRDCGLSGVSVARSEALLAGTADLIAPNRTTVNVAAAPSVTSNVGGGGNGGSGVPSNAPPASSSANGHAPTSNGSSNGSSAMANVNASGMATRRRAAATSSGPGSSPVTAPAPQMVAVGGGGGQGGRYGGY